MELLIIPLYFLPWIIASIRKHNNTGPIALVTFLLGWTGIGWIAALVWAATDNVTART